MYDLKHATKAWYERLSNFFLEKKVLEEGRLTQYSLLKTKNDGILVVQIYVDIIFGATNECLCEEFAKDMHKEFEISMMGELNYFLGLQIKQLKDGFFINQSNILEIF